jgi:hypothetical protein
MNNNSKLKRILQEDDASKFLDSLPEAERRPQYIQNRLPKSPESFSKEEVEAAKAIYVPAEDE